jgi:hypothetical protein
MTRAFERSHSILIDATPAEVLDYVSNPNTWPEWIAASHEIEAPDRPLAKGETFRENWVTRTGPAALNWRVTDCRPAAYWIAEADTSFIGRIVCRYDVEAVDGGTRYTRTIRNPARPKPPTDDMIRRIDEEAAVCLQNIKRNVEKRAKAG